MQALRDCVCVFGCVRGMRMSSEWRALTVQNPHCWFICHSGKRVENRTWRVPEKYMQSGDPFRVMLHAGQTWDRDWLSKPHGRLAGLFERRPDGIDFRLDTRVACGDAEDIADINDGRGVWRHMPNAYVVATMTITSQHNESCGLVYEETGLPLCNLPDYSASCSQWAMAGTHRKPMWHWELGDVQVLTNPVPAKGRLGLWKPDAETIGAVEAQLAAVV